MSNVARKYWLAVALLVCSVPSSSLLSKSLAKSRGTIHANLATSANSRCQRVALQRSTCLERALLASAQCIFVLGALNQVPLRFHGS